MIPKAPFFRVASLAVLQGWVALAGPVLGGEAVLSAPGVFPTESAKDSEDMKAQVLSAKKDEFVTLTGALVRVSGDPARFPNPVAWTSSIAGEYCYVLLVEGMVNHGGTVPPQGSAGFAGAAFPGGG